MSQLLLVLTLGLLKTLILIYDVITLPIYFLVQKPWIRLQKARRIRAKFQNEEDPYSSLIRLPTDTQNSHGIDISAYKTIPEILQACCRHYKDTRCLGYRRILAEEWENQPNGKIFRKLILADDYEWVSYEEVDQKVDKIVKGFQEIGIRSGDRVIVFAEGCMDWMLSAQAIFRNGSTLVTLYATLGDDGIVHGINQADVTHVVTSSELILKLITNEAQMPHLKTIIYFDNALGKRPNIPDETKDRFEVYSLSQILEKSKSVTDEMMRERITLSKGDDNALLMYTSGSTGSPKGVEITHNNFIASYKALMISIWSDYEMDDNEMFIAYLPLAHILELAAEMMMITQGVPIGYSSCQTMLDNSSAIKKGLRGDIKLLRPTIMPAVPLILDRIRRGVMNNIKDAGNIPNKIFEFASDYKRFWVQKGFRTPFTDRLVFNFCRKFTGGQLKLMIVGGAPLSPETQEFIRNILDVSLLQGYGATETTATTTGMDIFDLQLGKVGAPMYGCHIRLRDWREGGYFATDKPYPRGELIVGGAVISKGYYQLPEETDKNYYEEDGLRWWLTGDIGEVHQDGTIKIIDRKKDLVKLQFGEYISLGKVETKLKNCEYVDNICVHGDSFHMNLVALIVPNRSNLKRLAKEFGKESLSISEMCKDRKIVDAVKRALFDHGSKTGLLKVEIPSDITLCSEEWVPSTGLVTAALKIRRKQIIDYYKNEINFMYSGNGTKST